MCDNKFCKKNDRILDVYGKCNDLSSFTYANTDCDGYVPDIGVIGGGDEITFSLCMSCGKIQGKFPIDHGTVIAAINGIDEDEDDEFVDTFKYTVDEINKQISGFISLDLSAEELSSTYDDILDDDWSKFKFVAKALLDVDLNEVGCVKLFKKLPNKLQILGLIEGVDSIRFDYYLRKFFFDNKVDLI